MNRENFRPARNKRFESISFAANMLSLTGQQHGYSSATYLIAVE
jgi:hypothetical protein